MRPYIKLPIASVIKRASSRPGFELSDEQLEKLKAYSDVLLVILGAVGMVTMLVLAPNAFQALDIFQKQRRGTKKLKYKEKQRKVISTFYYLRRWGHIDFRQKGNDYEVILTDKGKKCIKKLNIETLNVRKPEKWDGKFWQVAADIPTKKFRRGADALRRKLKQMNFYPLQRTLWFYPHDPRIEIEFIARTYGIANFVTVMKLAELDPADEKVLRGYFKEQGII